MPRRAKSGRISLPRPSNAFAFLFPERESEAPSPYNPRLRLAADLYNLGLIKSFASADGAKVEIRNGSYELPFGRVTVRFDPSALEWHNRRIVALTPVDGLEIHGLTNRYHHPGIGAALAASTEPIVSERGMQVSPLMKMPITVLLRLDGPRRQLAQRHLRAELNLYNTQDVSTVTIAGRSVPLEADQTAVLAYVLASSQIWEREFKAFFSGVFSEAAPTQLSSIDTYRPGAHSGSVRPRHRLKRRALGRDGQRSARRSADPRASSILVLHLRYQQPRPLLGGTAARSPSRGRAQARPGRQRSRALGNGDYWPQPGRPARQSDGHRHRRASVGRDRLQANRANRPCARRARPVASRALHQTATNVRRVVFIATPHRGSFLAEFSAARLVGRFITLPARIMLLGARLATRNSKDFRFDPDNLGTGSLLGMTPSNPVVQAMAAMVALASMRIRSSRSPTAGQSKAAMMASSRIRARILTASSPNTLSGPAIRRSRTLIRSRRCAASCCFTPPMSAPGSPATSHLYRLAVRCR
jgi:hypothetical protein